MIMGCIKYVLGRIHKGRAGRTFDYLFDDVPPFNCVNGGRCVGLACAYKYRTSPLHNIVTRHPDAG